MRTSRRQRRSRFKSRAIRFLLLVAIGGLIFNYLRPLPGAAASIVSLGDSSQSVHLDWPVKGSAAIGAQGFGVLETHGSDESRPTASLAKLITVLAVLEKYPLRENEQGPTLTMGEKDVQLYSDYYNHGGAYVIVQNGEKITEYQALQAILLPSANNMADSLAIWAFGSMEGYLAYANDMVKRLGLSRTTVATDASGMSPHTKSTTKDLIRLGELALGNEVIDEIIKQPSATIPVHGAIHSANSRLITNRDIIGIKTGLTDEAGGCFLFATRHHTAQDKPVTIIGVITGASNLREAFKESEPLLHSAKRYFSVKTPIKAGDTFATLTTPWLTTAKVIAKGDISLMSWNGKALNPRVELARINRSLPVGAQVGTAIVASGANMATTPLVLQEAISGPSWQWRVKRLL